MTSRRGFKHSRLYFTFYMIVTMLEHLLVLFRIKKEIIFALNMFWHSKWVFALNMFWHSTPQLVLGEGRWAGVREEPDQNLTYKKTDLAKVVTLPKKGYCQSAECQALT